MAPSRAALPTFGSPFGGEKKKAPFLTERGFFILKERSDPAKARDARYTLFLEEGSHPAKMRDLATRYFKRRL